MATPANTAPVTGNSIEMLDYLETSGQITAAAVKMAEAVEAERQRVAPLVQTVSQGLEQAGLIQAMEKTAAVQKLSSHEGALEVLANQLRIQQAERAAWQQEKQAMSAQMLGSPVRDGASPQHRKTANAVITGARRGYDDGPSEAERLLYNRTMGIAN